jgi:outer membrane murein-binding lipoprotein Lpp
MNAGAGGPPPGRSEGGSAPTGGSSGRPVTIIPATAGSLALDEQNPWPGLASYDEASSPFFKGREADAAELVRLIKLSPFVTFYGKSGLGKSSVLQAGVFPALRTAHFLPVHLRLDYAETAQLPLMEQAALRLRQEIIVSKADAPEPEPGETLWAYLQRRDTPIWGADNFPLTPVLVFDQFEEVFSRGGSPAHVRRVLEEMADFAADRLPKELTDDRNVVKRLDLQTQQYHVVLAFRSDFLAEVMGWVKRSNLPHHESLHLTAMPRERAVQAIARPGKAVLEPGVAEQIVDFLLQREVKGDGTAPVVVSPLGGEVEPALLSLCCYQLNRKRKPNGKIDAELLRAFGASILADFYREAIKDMPPRVPRFIEENLILGDRYRNPYPREVALSRPDGLTADELHQLTKNRLLRLDPQGDELRIELIHDRLVGVVREARDARHAREAQEAERAVAEKQQREALEKVERERLAAEQRVQLERERERAEREGERAAATERERARVTRWRNGLLVAALAMVAMIAGLVVQSDRARRANAELANNFETLNDTVKSLNENLEAAKEDGEEARRELAQAKTRLAQLELDLAKADAAKNAGAAAATARVRDAEAQVQQQAARAQAYQASRQSLGRQPTYTVQDWRLASNGCGKGTVSISGQASFIVIPGSGTVEVREVFNGRGDGFTVTIDSKATLPAKNPGCYELPTVGNWSASGRSFKTQGVDRVCVNAEGKPVGATISRIRTDCGY